MLALIDYHTHQIYRKTRKIWHFVLQKVRKIEIGKNSRQCNVSSRTAKTLNYKTFRLFIERTMKSEDGDAVTSPSISRLAVLSQYCEVLPCLRRHAILLVNSLLSVRDITRCSSLRKISSWDMLLSKVFAYRHYRGSEQVSIPDEWVF